MKNRKIIIGFIIFTVFTSLLFSEKETPTEKISLTFLKKYLNIQLKRKYYVSYISKTDYSITGIILEIDRRIGFPFFVKFIKDLKKEEKKEYKYKFNGFPANKRKDGTVVVKITKNIVVGMSKPLKGYGDPIAVLKMLDFKTAIEKAGK